MTPVVREALRERHAEIERRKGRASVDELLAGDPRSRRTARQAFLDFGKGRHRAGLNFGDRFSHAPAKATGEPLLFKGKHFGQTDIQGA